MLFDWFTFVAQIINFMILIWLLKRYLYEPILKSLDEREKRISMQLADAEKAKTEALHEKNRFRNELDSLDRRKNDLLTKAEEDAENVKRELLEKIRSESETMRSGLLESIRKEYGEISGDITRRNRDEIFAVSRKIISELSDSELEERISDVFIRKIKNLDEADRNLLKAAIKSTRSNISLRCVFGLSDKAKSEITDAISKITGEAVRIHIGTDDSLVCGIELAADGYRLSWNVSEYIMAMEASITRSIEEKSSII